MDEAIAKAPSITRGSGYGCTLLESRSGREGPSCDFPTNPLLCQTMGEGRWPVLLDGYRQGACHLFQGRLCRLQRHRCATHVAMGLGGEILPSASVLHCCSRCSGPQGAGMPGQQALTPRAQGRHENREDTGTGPQTLRQCHWCGLRAGPHQNLQGAGAVVRLCLQACSRCPGSMSATSGLLMGRAFPRESEALRVAPCRRSPLGPVDNPRWPSDPAHQEPGSP